MANSIDAVKQLQNEIDKLTGQLVAVNSEIVKISKSTREVGDGFRKIKTPNKVNDSLKKTAGNIETINALYKQQDSLEKNLINTQAKQKLAVEGTNKAYIKSRFELQQQNKLVKDAAVLGSNYANLLQKTIVLRNREAKTIQNLNLKKELGNKLSDREQKELKQSTTAFNKYDKAIKKTKNSVGRFQENVGNYPKLLGSITSLTTGLIGSFGVIEGLRLAIDFGADAVRLSREAKGVEIAFNDLGNAGVAAFDDIKKSTRGTLSDLEIKKSINEFNNLGISLEASGVAFEFLAVRAAQTGKSVESMKEDLVTGLGRGSVRILDNLGLSMAELNKLTKEQGLSTQEAFGVIAQQEIAKAGDILEKSANNQEKFTAAYENFKLSIGDGAIGNFSNSVYGLGTSFSIAGKQISDASNNMFEFFINSGLVATGLGKVVEQRANENNEERKRAKLLEEINTLQKERGVSDDKAYNIQTRLSQLTTENIQKVLDSEKRRQEAIKSREKESGAIKLTVTELRNKNAELVKEQGGLTESDKARSNAINNEISNNKRLIDSILGVKGARQGVVELDTDIEPKGIEDLDTKGVEVIGIDKDKLIADVDEIVTNLDLIEKWTKEAEVDEIIKQGLGELAGTIEEFTGVGGDKFLDFFDKITEGGSKSFGDLADIAASSFSLASDVSGAFFQSKIDGYEADIEANNEYYANLLENENLSDEEKDRLETDRKNKEKKLKKEQAKEKEKQFQINKLFRIGEIIADTASAIVKTGASLGYPAAIPFQIQAGILGASQLAIVASQSPPKFAEGGVMGHDGDMIINDHHTGRLELVERKGKLLMTDKKNARVKGEKGDIIHKDANDYFKNKSDGELIKNIEMHSILASINRQNIYASRLDNKKTADLHEISADRIVKAIKSQKTKFNLTQNINLADDLRYLDTKNNML